MFKRFGKLPDEVGRQDPVRLFDILFVSEDEPPEEYTGNDPYLRMFYGL